MKHFQVFGFACTDTNHEQFFYEPTERFEYEAVTWAEKNVQVLYLTVV